jgi:hypothetical protein
MAGGTCGSAISVAIVHQSICGIGGRRGRVPHGDVRALPDILRLLDIG